MQRSGGSFCCLSTINTPSRIFYAYVTAQVWGTSHDTKSHYLHVYIGHLRRKIELILAHPRFLTTISGVGYRFNDNDDE